MRHSMRHSAYSAYPLFNLIFNLILTAIIIAIVTTTLTACGGSGTGEPPENHDVNTVPVTCQNPSCIH